MEYPNFRDSAPVAQVACTGLATRGERNRNDEVAELLASDRQETVGGCGDR